MRKSSGVIINLIILLWVLIPSITFAQTGLENLSEAQIQALITIKYNLATLDDLQERGVLSADMAEAERQHYLAKAQTVIGEPLELDQLLALLDRFDSRQLDETQGMLQRISGFFTFINIIWTISSILLVIAVGWLIRLYIVPILKQIPAVVYEALIYMACLAFIGGGQWFARGIDQFIVLPGCLGLVGALIFTNKLHNESLQKFYKRNRLEPFTLHSFILFLIWAGVAIIYQSVLIAFMAVIALEAFLGFSVLVTPLCYYIGFRKKSIIPRAMAASFLLLLFYIVVRITRIELPYFDIFSVGVLFMGSFVYFIGLLIVSSKWYKHKDAQHYIVMQLLTIVSGIQALFFGSVWQISQLQGIGGTFFFLYLLEKYFELPWLKKRWAWATLGLSIILYLSSLVIRQYPQYFLFIGV